MSRHQSTIAFVRHHCRRLLATTALLLPLPVPAEVLVCHLSYGGETRDVVAQPVLSPYGVPVQTIGSYFLFRMTFQKEPADLATIKIYVFANRDGGPLPIHQATHAYPPLAGTAEPYGFTGLNRVYEPTRDGELEYWCALSPATMLAP